MNPQNTRRIPLLLGIPDNGMARVGLDPVAGMISVVLTGNAPYRTQVSKAVMDRLPIVYFGSNLNPRVTQGKPGAPLVNGITEPDLCKKALESAAGLVRESGARCFNAPEAILGSRRDLAAQALADIEGLVVPRVLRLRIDEPSELAPALASAGLGYPVLVRVAGGHGNSPLVKIDAEQDIKAALRQLPWGGHELYVSEFVDYRGEDGLYRKMRLVVVGRELYLRHHIAAADWKVHAEARLPEPELIDRELAEIEDFENGLQPRVKQQALAIADSLGLDYFGIDAALLGDGRLLVFEANAAMNVLYDSNPQEPRWAKQINRIRSALVSLLFSPERWRHGRTGTTH